MTGWCVAIGIGLGSSLSLALVALVAALDGRLLSLVVGALGGTVEDVDG